MITLLYLAQCKDCECVAVVIQDVLTMQIYAHPAYETCNLGNFRLVDPSSALFAEYAKVVTSGDFRLTS